MLRRIKTELQVGGGVIKKQKNKNNNKWNCTYNDKNNRETRRRRCRCRLCTTRYIGREHRTERGESRTCFVFTAAADSVIMDNNVVYYARCKLLNDVFIASMACSNCQQWQTEAEAEDVCLPSLHSLIFHAEMLPTLTQILHVCALSRSSCALFAPVYAALSFRTHTHTRVNEQH